MDTVVVDKSWTGSESGTKEVHATKVGTGSVLKIWLGWIFLRSATAQMEIQSEGFILHAKKKSYKIKQAIFEELYHDAGLLTEKRVPVHSSQPVRVSLSTLL